MRLRFYTADVFTDRIFGGNPLAVFPQALGLGPVRMQQIARELNLSETVFVLPPENPEHTRRLRIFTPLMEVPFAGHPTVGTAYVLAALGEVELAGERTTIVFEEGVGPVRVEVQAAQGRPVASTLSAARMPEFGPEPPSAARLAAMLLLRPEDLAGGDLAPQAVSCGYPFLFVPLRDREALGRAFLDVTAWNDLLGTWWAQNVHCFALDPEREGSDVRARMFAPAAGIQEDPATGSAAAALAGYLGVRNPLGTGTLRWVVEQGFEMGRPSILEVEADKRDGAIVAVRVGGSSVLVSEGIMEVPEQAG
jgi:trans-2,3-dihydro-3-hydroxyanthranilate isomerase